MTAFLIYLAAATAEQGKIQNIYDTEYTREDGGQNADEHVLATAARPREVRGVQADSYAKHELYHFHDFGSGFLLFSISLGVYGN
jgi:hypothetical protein